MWQVKKREALAASVAEPVAEASPAPIQPLFETSAESERWLDLKVGIHRKLLGRINLALLDKLSREQIEAEIGDIVMELLVEADEALNARERKQLVGEVLDELLGLGPLEPPSRTRASPTSW